MAGNKLLKSMPLDIFYNFDVDPITEGGEVGIGSRGAYFYRYGHNEIGDGLFKTDNETILEIRGMSIYGPFDLATGLRVPLQHVQIYVDKTPIKDCYVNECMSPMYRYMDGGKAFNPVLRESQNSPINVLFGKGMLSAPVNPADPATASWQPTIKVGPDTSLDVRVKFPRIDEGGVAAIDERMMVRLDVTEVRDENLLRSVLNANGHLTGDQVQQSMSFGDRESGKTINIQKTVPFGMKNWDELNGGIRASRPFITRYLNYTMNGLATRVNESYPFEDANDRIIWPSQEMFWQPMPMNEAIQITDIGVIGHPNLEHIEFYKSGNTTQTELRADTVTLQYAPPVTRDPAMDGVLNGPNKLPRIFTVMPGEKAGLRMIDTGTSIPAWAAGVDGVKIMAYGYKFYLENEVAQVEQ
jgi:hypothetical protein